MNRLLCLGLGYTARRLASRLPRSDWTASGTKRPPVSADSAPDSVDRVLPFDGETVEPGLEEALAGATHLLISIPPDEHGDRFLAAAGEGLAAADDLAWVGYLSTTGVYGDREGGWVDETSECRPTSERSRRRLTAEEQWLELHRDSGLPVHIFRLAGIYGPGRNVLEEIRSGERPRRIRKAGHYFNRIHVDDIAGALHASIGAPRPGRIYNLSDDEPSPRHHVIDYACRLLGEDPESLLDSRRVSNRRLEEELGYALAYPTYREGLRGLGERLPTAG